MSRKRHNLTELPKRGSTALQPRATIKRFTLTYLILMGAFFQLIQLRSIRNSIDLDGIYTKWVVIVTSKALHLLAMPNSFQGSIIMLPTVSLDVKFGCNGLEAVMIYGIAVLAFPAPWKSKIAGIVSGFLIIQLLNIVRLTLLAYSAIHFKNLFEYIHIYVAQGIMIAVSLALFFVYLHYAEDPKRANC